MIRKLRRKFLGIAMLSLLGTLAFLVAAIAVGNAILSANRADRAIALLYENGGAFPLPDSAPNPALGFDFQVREETPFETRYFIVHLSENQEVLSVDTEHIAALDRQTVIESLNAVLRSGAEKGYVDHYYRFGVFADEGGGSTVIVLDCFLQVQASLNMLRVTLLVSLAGALIVFVILLFSSRVAIRPFVENLERQRRFVTDASHELKTPLAILSADLGLLSDGAQESPWLESANAQVARLNRLIHNLVELARTEESVKPAAMETLNLSEIVQANVDAFQPLAEADGKVLISDVAPGVRMRGVQDNLFRLLTILLDNAVKYCDAGGEVRVSLALRGRSALLSVSNPCQGLNPADLPKYFDRFYRADSSRARETGGYGIGLSTAKAIVTRHKGRIANKYASGVITFSVLLPLGLRRARD